MHFHTLIPDGVFDLSRPGRGLFVRLPAPGEEELERILTRIIKKVTRHIARDREAERAMEEDAFAGLQGAEVDRRRRFPDPFKHARHSVALDGFSLHAGLRIHEHDREGLERLCRYAVRPPFALHRLSRGPDGNLLYKMKRPRSGALFLLLTPDQLLARIATLVPPPRTHAIRYHGVFAPNSKDRARVVPDDSGGEPGQLVPEHHRDPARPQPAPRPAVAPTSPTGLGPFQLSPQPAPVTGDAARLGPRYRVPWAELLRKVFSIDVLDCPQCGGRMQLVAFIAEAGVAKRILEHLGLPSTGPPVARSPAPEETFDPGPAYDGADSTWDE